MIDVDMFAYSHLGFRFLWMSSSACAKCRRGSAAEGDSWCLGCLALENSATSLKGNWWSSSHRRLGEEIVVQAAKQLRAVKSLDTSLQPFADSCEARLRKASAPVAGARRPPEPPHPPRSRAKLVEASVAPVPVKQEEAKADRPTRAPPVAPASPVSEVDWEGEDERSRSESEKGGPSPSSPPYKEEVAAHPTGERSGAGRRSHPPAEHRDRSRSPHRKRHRGPRPGHRGGAKHQKRYRDIHQPGAVRHRAWSGDQVAIPHRSSRGVLDEDI